MGKLQSRRVPRQQQHDMTAQARALHTDVVRRSGDVQEQLLMLPSLARNHAASSADVAAVKGQLLAGHVRECGDAR